MVLILAIQESIGSNSAGDIVVIDSKLPYYRGMIQYGGPARIYQNISGTWTGIGSTVSNGYVVGINSAGDRIITGDPRHPAAAFELLTY